MKTFKSIFFDWLKQRLKENPQSVLFYADLGYPHVNELKDLYPQQVFNLGVRENLAILMGIVWSTDVDVYVYGASSFLIERAFETLRLYGHLAQSLVIVGHASGLSYGRLGPTHWSVNDATLWHLSQTGWYFAPRCDVDLIWALNHHSRPLYLRLIHSPNQHPQWLSWVKMLEPGKPLWIRIKNQGRLHVVEGSLIHDLPFLGLTEDLVVTTSYQNLEMDNQWSAYNELVLWVEHQSLHPLVTQFSGLGKRIHWGLQVPHWPRTVNSRPRMVAQWVKVEF